MTFNVQCVLSGLNAYVPNREARPTGMAVIMADARERGRTARDKQELAPHFPLLIVDARFTPASSGLPPNSKIVWPLDRLALRFDARGGTPAGLNVLADTNTDFGLVPTLYEAAPDFTTIDGNCFKNRESKRLIAARLILDRGHLGAHDFHPDKVPTFRFDGKLGDTSREARKMSNRVGLTLENVEGFTILWRDMDKDEGEKAFKLVASAGETVSFDVGNFCDGCLPRRIEDQNQIKRFEDVDFRWYYELCERREEIRIPKEEFLPIPVIDSGGGGPGAIQCMGGRFAARTF